MPNKTLRDIAIEIGQATKNKLLREVE